MDVVLPATHVIRGRLLEWQSSDIKRWRRVTFLTFRLRVFRRTVGPVGPKQVLATGPLDLLCL